MSENTEVAEATPAVTPEAPAALSLIHNTEPTIPY